MRLSKELSSSFFVHGGGLCSCLHCLAGFQPQEPLVVLGDRCLDTQSQKASLSTPVNLMFSKQVFFGQACRTPSSLTRGVTRCVLINTIRALGHLNLWGRPSGPLSVRTQLASLSLIIFI